MTIDDRLDRLTERHEALTQTVELIAAAQLKTDERLAQLEEHMVRLEEHIGRIDESLLVLAGRSGQLMDTMNRLANIIISHEERIERLEDRK